MTDPKYVALRTSLLLGQLGTCTQQEGFVFCPEKNGYNLHKQNTEKAKNSLLLTE